MIVKRSMTSRRLKCMSRKGYNIANVERILEIPQGTLRDIMNLKNKPLPEEVSLIKIIFRMPFLLEVYDELIMKRYSDVRKTG